MKRVVITSKFLPGNLECYCKDRKIHFIRLNNDLKSIEPKLLQLFRLLLDSAKVLKYLKPIRRCKVILSVSYITIPLLLFRKLGLIKKDTIIIWEGFFLHEKRYFALFGFIFRLLFSTKDRLIVYSSFERKLYSIGLKINKSQIHHVPLVFAPDPSKKTTSEYSKRIEWNTIPTDFYFSGGYSHRDYATLIEAFRHIKSRLVICSSKLNEELTKIKIPENVMILNDVSSEDFKKLIQRAKACILLIKNNSGAAGQLFALEVMYSQKIIIASATDVLKEIITNQESGFITAEPLSDIPILIDKIDRSLLNTELIGKNAKLSILNTNNRDRYNLYLDMALQATSSTL